MTFVLLRLASVYHKAILIETHNIMGFFFKFVLECTLELSSVLIFFIPNLYLDLSLFCC